MAESTRPVGLLALAVAWSLAWPRAAPAAEVDLRLQLVGQGYQTRTVSGELLDRRRITEWAWLRAERLFDLEGFGLQVQFRFDTDLGLDPDLTGRAGDLADLLQAALNWRGLFDALDVSLGRQLVIDELDFFAFDGLLLQARLPLQLQLRLLGGLAVRDRSWLGDEVLELDGVESGSVPAPAVGAALQFSGFGVWASLDYRRLVLWQPGFPLDEERLGGAVAVRLLDSALGLDAGAVRDLLQDDWQRLRADGWGRVPLPGVDLRLEVGGLRSRPLFALDSIFNFFAPAPFAEAHAALRLDLPLGARGRVPADRRASPLGLLLGLPPEASVRLAYFHRAYQGAAASPFGEPAAPPATVDGGSLDGRLRWGTVQGSLLVSLEAGAAGRRWLLAPGGSGAWFDGRLALEGRALVLGVDDPIQDSLDVITLGASAGASWRFGDQQALVVVADVNGNRLQPLSLRLLVVLDLAYGYGPGGWR